MEYLGFDTQCMGYYSVRDEHSYRIPLTDVKVQDNWPIVWKCKLCSTCYLEIMQGDDPYQYYKLTNGEAALAAITKDATWLEAEALRTSKRE